MRPYVRELHGLDTDALVSYLRACPAPFEPSYVYHVSSQDRVVDKELRTSEYRHLRDPAIFALARQLVDNISASDEIMSYTLGENDVTHIKYDQGGFFRAHQDFLTVTSNCIQEYTLLVCVTPPEATALTKGGETRVEVSPGHELLSRSTVTAGGGLVFRKDLMHEGLPVTEGTKEIVAINVWASRKDVGHVLLVTFASELQKKAEPIAPLQAIAGSRSYALSSRAIEAFPTCILNGKLNFEGSKTAACSTGSSNSPRCSSPPLKKPCEEQLEHAGTPIRTRALITDFFCTEHTYEQFEVVFRVLNNLYIRPCDLVQHASVLDYFGIPVESVLIAVVNMGNAGHAEGELRGFETVKDDRERKAPASGGGSSGGVGFGSDGSSDGGRGQIKEAAEDSGTKDGEAITRTIELLPLPPMRVRLDGTVEEGKRTWSRINRPVADEAIIVCTTAECALVVAEAAKELKLPYVRFYSLWAEGIEREARKVPLQPMWVTVGDHNNILGVRRITTTRLEDSLNGVLLDGPYTNHANKAVLERVLSTPECLFLFHGYEYDAPTTDNPPDQRGIKRIVATGDMGGFFGLKASAVVVTGETPPTVGPYTKADIFNFLRPSDDEAGVGPWPVMRTLPGADDVSAKYPYFHLDSEGATCFSAEEAKAATQHLIDMKFMEHVRERIGVTRFLLPQERRTGEVYFCNEEWPGRLNFIEVTGVVRLAPLNEPLPPPAEFPWKSESDEDS